MKLKRFLMFMSFAVLFTVFLSITVAAQETENVAELPYVIEEGAVYYESSFNFGSGKSAIVNGTNIYTTDPCYAGINGYSFLDDQGRIIAFQYDEETDDIYVPEAPSGTAEIFMHFKSINYRNGWVNSKSVIPRGQTKLDDDVVEPESVVEEIQEYTQSGLKTAVVIDYSGSMTEHQRKVVELLGQLEFDANTTVIVFATTFEIITTEQLANHDFDVGGLTHMYQALNKANDLGVEQMILISDLQTFNDVELQPSEELKSVVIYDPFYGNNVVESDLRRTWKNARINRTAIG